MPRSFFDAENAVMRGPSRAQKSAANQNLPRKGLRFSSFAIRAGHDCINNAPSMAAATSSVGALLDGSSELPHATHPSGSKSMVSRLIMKGRTPYCRWRTHRPQGAAMCLFQKPSHNPTTPAKTAWPWTGIHWLSTHSFRCDLRRIVFLPVPKGDWPLVISTCGGSTYSGCVGRTRPNGFVFHCIVRPADHLRALPNPFLCIAMAKTKHILGSERSMRSKCRFIKRSQSASSPRAFASAIRTRLILSFSCNFEPASHHLPSNISAVQHPVDP